MRSSSRAFECIGAQDENRTVGAEIKAADDFRMSVDDVDENEDGRS